MSPLSGDRRPQGGPNMTSFGHPGMPGEYDPRNPYGRSDNDDNQSYVRYGRIPQRQPRRYKTIKRVELYHGNLVLDCKVPAKLLSMCPRKDDREFTHMRYTAATCDVSARSLKVGLMELELTLLVVAGQPNDFKSERFTLRQVLYEPPRRTEL